MIIIHTCTADIRTKFLLLFKNGARTDEKVRGNGGRNGCRRPWPITIACVFRTVVFETRTCRSIPILSTENAAPTPQNECFDCCSFVRISALWNGISYSEMADNCRAEQRFWLILGASAARTFLVVVVVLLLLFVIVVVVVSFFYFSGGRQC